MITLCKVLLIKYFLTNRTFCYFSEVVINENKDIHKERKSSNTTLNEYDTIEAEALHYIVLRIKN